MIMTCLKQNVSDVGVTEYLTARGLQDVLEIF